MPSPRVGDRAGDLSDGDARDFSDGDDLVDAGERGERKTRGDNRVLDKATLREISWLDAAGESLDNGFGIFS